MTTLPKPVLLPSIVTEAGCERVEDCDITSDGSLVIFGTDSGNVSLCSLKTLSQTPLTGCIGDVNVARFFPSDQVAYTAGMDFTLRVWHLASGTCARELPIHTRAIQDAAHIDRGRMVYTVGRDGCKMVDIGQKTIISDYEGDFETCCLNSDGSTLIAGSESCLKLVDPRCDQATDIDYGPPGTTKLSLIDNKVICGIHGTAYSLDMAQQSYEVLLEAEGADEIVGFASLDGQFAHVTQTLGVFLDSHNYRNRQIVRYTSAKGKENRLVVGSDAGTLVWNTIIPPPGPKLPVATTL